MGSKTHILYEKQNNHGGDIMDFDKGTELCYDEHPLLSKTNPEVEKKLRDIFTDQIISPPVEGLTGALFNVDAVHGSHIRKLDEAGLKITGFWWAPNKDGEAIKAVQVVVNWKEE